jgi:Spy/CpxP family protein refolding chaperone
MNMKKFLLAAAVFIGMTSFSMAQAHRPVHHSRKEVHHHYRHHAVHHSHRPVRH